MSAYVLSPEQSQVRIHTYAEGLLARLAHDLELRCGGLSGTATRDGDAGTAVIEAKIGSIAVAGILRGDRVDDEGLSPSDAHDIVEKMKKEVFHAGSDALVVVEVALDRGDARVKLTFPNGRTYDATTRAYIREDGGSVRASGCLDVSLSRIGSDAVKGPMGAFRVKDGVQVLFDLAFQPA